MNGDDSITSAKTIPYSELRQRIRTGDVIAYEKIPITAIRGCLDIGG